MARWEVSQGKLWIACLGLKFEVLSFWDFFMWFVLFLSFECLGWFILFYSSLHSFSSGFSIQWFLM